MMSYSQAKSVIFNIRAKLLQQLLIDKAATMLSKTRTDFMLEASCREAENVLLDNTLFLLSKDKFKRFTELLDAPIAKRNEIKSLLESISPWEK
jgi:uncharacterized protein (DUF1778 family)